MRNKGTSVMEEASIVVSDSGGDFYHQNMLRDNSSCYPSFVEPLRFANTHQCDTDSGDCCPRAPRHDRD